jgi:hypothetical protein
MKRTFTRELARRAADGLEVVLLWRQCDDRLIVSVADSRTGDSFEVPADGENALDVFYHPFAYAPTPA